MFPKGARREPYAIGYGILLWLAVGLFAYHRYGSLSISEWVVMYTLLGLLMLTGKFDFMVSGRIVYTWETTYLVAFLLVYPLNSVVYAVLIHAIIMAVRERKKWRFWPLNGGLLAASSVCAVYVYRLFLHLFPSSQTLDFFSILVFSVSYFFINVLLLLFYLLIRFGINKGIVAFKDSFSAPLFIVYAVGILTGVLMKYALENAGLTGALLFTVLITLVSYTYQDYFKMNTHFKNLATTDELTGLYNHRQIHSVMDSFIEDKRPFSLLMFDVDKFKRYNERYGHVQGDEALKQIAGVFQEETMSDAHLARYSGENFAIVLPDYDISQAQLKAEILRRSISETDFPAAQGKTTRLTTSVGVVRYPDMADTKKELLIKVDEALYRGKVTGRNKVSIFSSVLDEMRMDMMKTETDEEIVKTIQVFLAILNSKDRYTYAHTERDVIYSVALAKRIGLSDKRLRNLRFGAFLHDIGKVEIPLEVLTKRGPLSKQEWALMKSHVELGENIARPMKNLADCLPIIRHHHERYDGTGYPDNLKGNEIPLEARILTIADSFDAMTTSRPYQHRRSLEYAFQELWVCAGKQFDPDLIAPFIECVKEIGLLTDEVDEDES